MIKENGQFKMINSMEIYNQKLLEQQLVKEE